MFRNALSARRVSNSFLKSTSVQKLSFSSQKTKKLSELTSQEASTLLTSLHVTDHKLDGMSLSLVQNQADLDDLSIKIPNIKFRALQKYLERFETDGVPLELIQSPSSETIVLPSLSEADNIGSLIVRTTEETNKESTSLLLPGFTFIDSSELKTEKEFAAYPSVKKGDYVQLGSVWELGIINKSNNSK
jgi:hypothetical protein